jgi:hypothetical protein
MTRFLYIAVAVAAIGCGHSNDSAATQSNERGREGRDQTAGTPQLEQRRSTDGNAAAQQRVQLTGCLQGESATPASPGVRPESPATRGADANGSVFRLRRARADPGNAGVGANGAGGTGGPLVSGTSDYLLEGDVSELRSHLDQEVQVTGTIDPHQIAVPQAGGAANEPGRGTPRPAEPAGGTRASPSPPSTAGGPTSASSGASSGGNSNAGLTQQSVAVRQLLVESVRTVAATCSAS